MGKVGWSFLKEPETEIPCCKMKSLSVVNVVTADRSSGAHHICYSEIFFLAVQFLDFLCCAPCVELKIMTCITKNNEIQLTLRLQQLKKMLGSLNFLGFSKWGLASWSVFCMDDGMCFNRLFCKKTWPEHVERNFASCVPDFRFSALSSTRKGDQHVAWHVSYSYLEDLSEIVGTFWQCSF